MGQLFEFVMAIGNIFLPIYTHLIRKNKDKAFGEKEKQWQLLRRGRYAEFNLVYDRGTKFGLETNGRIESILMSLPPQANWTYNFVPEKNSEEEKTTTLLKKGIKW
jgi:coproporphyrinogen III oxidase